MWCWQNAPALQLRVSIGPLWTALELVTQPIFINHLKSFQVTTTQIYTVQRTMSSLPPRLSSWAAENNEMAGCCSIAQQCCVFLWLLSVKHADKARLHFLWNHQESPHSFSGGSHESMLKNHLAFVWLSISIESIVSYCNMVLRFNHLFNCDTFQRTIHFQA